MNNVSKYVETGETSNYSMFVSPLHQRDITDSNIKNIMKHTLSTGDSSTYFKYNLVNIFLSSNL